MSKLDSYKILIPYSRSQSGFLNPTLTEEVPRQPLGRDREF